MKISEQLREAAAWLTPVYGENEHPGVDFICHALCAVKHGHDWMQEWTKMPLFQDRNWPAVQFLIDLGMNPDGGGFIWADDYEQIPLDNEEKQSARFMWCHFAADRAEEMGL